MTAQARPNLGGLFNGSTPADRVSSIAGKLGPSVVSAPVGAPQPDPTPETSAIGLTADVRQPGPEGPVSWIDPIRALELYFGLLQAVLDANRQLVMGVAAVLVSGGTRKRDGVGSIRTRT